MDMSVIISGGTGHIWDGGGGHLKDKFLSIFA